jgi:FtsP/CotA-like multicopper oxidase with cupredoxin domain
MVPGPAIRLTKGDVLRATLTNSLPEPTTIHWHGLAIRNDMDGVPGLTQKAIAPGSSFTYEFAVTEPGTFWFHPHSGLQLDRGLYGALLVDDPAETLSYDKEFTIVLDDWTDGVGESPDAILSRLTGGSSESTGGMHGMDRASPTGGGGHAMGGMAVAGSSPPLGGDAGDVRYPIYVLNGLPPSIPASFGVAAGERIRLRVINAGADTAFRFAVAGHKLTVTHTDGFPVEPVDVDAVLIGMGERYDVMVTVSDSGVFPLVALAEGKEGQAVGLVRSGAGDPPPPGFRPAELDGRLLQPSDLKATPGATLGARGADRVHRVTLTNDADRYRWRINGKTFDEREPLELKAGERVRLIFDNRTTMFHPMHLHGHTFQVSGPGSAGARKDTVIVKPKEQVVVDFDGDNPGLWLLHCHNVYHQETGMMTTLSYAR